MKTKKSTIKKNRRAIRVRAKIRGSASRPRLSVFRSHTAIYAQLIDDQNGRTLAAANSKTMKKLKKTELSAAVGELIAKKALELGVKKVIFDRGACAYHGRVKALADGARKGGLEF